MYNGFRVSLVSRVTVPACRRFQEQARFLSAFTQRHDNVSCRLASNPETYLSATLNPATCAAQRFVSPLSLSRVLKDDVVIIEHPKLQDGSTEAWPADVVSSHVHDFVQKFGIQTVRQARFLVHLYKACDERVD